MAFHRARTHAFSSPMNGKWAARSLRIFSGWAARKFVDHSGRRRASSGSSSNLVATSKWPARAWHTFSGDNHCRWNKGPLKKGQDKGPAISSPRMLFVTVIKPCWDGNSCHTSGERRWQVIFFTKGCFLVLPCPVVGNKTGIQGPYKTNATLLSLEFAVATPGHINLSSSAEAAIFWGPLAEIKNFMPAPRSPCGSAQRNPGTRCKNRNFFVLSGVLCQGPSRVRKAILFFALIWSELLCWHAEKPT